MFIEIFFLVKNIIQVVKKNLRIMVFGKKKQKTVLYFDQFLLTDLLRTRATGGEISS